ncbi:MAG: hypothetical protein GY913_21665 [Proteobacteria bacterium]|nr:hypothetical protein [Actinomycetes bacterium]MCP4919518.1 hypothetical protein [Pseudomonadota bacterium]
MLDDAGTRLALVCNGGRAGWALCSARGLARDQITRLGNLLRNLIEHELDTVTALIERAIGGAS